MLSLVAAPTPVQPDSVPETLLFDARRLVALQAEYERLVGGVTLLVVVSHAVAQPLAVSQENKRKVLAELADLVVASDCRSQELIDLVGAHLQSKLSDVLGAEEQAKVLKALAGVADKENPVHRLM
jgi:hypothetical protein